MVGSRSRPNCRGYANSGDLVGQQVNSSAGADLASRPHPVGAVRGVDQRHGEQGETQIANLASKPCSSAWSATIPLRLVVPSLHDSG